MNRSRRFQNCTCAEFQEFHLQRRFSFLEITAKLLAMSGVLSLAVLSGQVQAQLTDYDPEIHAPSNQVGFDFEGCRLTNDDGTYDPEGSGSFRCDAGAYVDGNLGKIWAEIDEVPHQLFIETNGINTVSETFRIVIGADRLVATDTDPETKGYDRISGNAPFFTKVSGDGECTSAIPQGPNQIGDFGIGGAIDEIAQVVEITQDADTVCRLDWTFRLAIGSRFVNGSSNQAYVIAGGKQTIPIPSNPAPQQLSKSMTAIEDGLLKWTISKMATPTNFGFGNTCNNDVPNTKDVVFDITFTKGSTEAGDLTATTMIDAINPSRRDVTYACTDVVYGVLAGAGSESPVDSQSPEFDVPSDPGTAMPEIEHILPPGTRGIRNELSCELFVDDLITQAPTSIGTIAAEFSLPDDDIAPGDVVNESVTVTDSESITVGATRYDFSATQSGGVSGSFDGGYSGAVTDGPVGWTSDSQTDSGTVQFTKTVSVERGYDMNGKLEDTASIDLTSTTDVSASASTTFSTDPKIDLKINKNQGLSLANDITWKFKVCTTNDCSDSADPVATKEITIPAGSSSGNVTAEDLDPGTYYVVEYEIPTGWVPSSNGLPVVLDLPSCLAEVTFTNNPAANFYADVEVQKVTNPAGSEDDWTFDLTGSSGGETAQVTTTDSNFIKFNLSGGSLDGADAGDYSITEQLRQGWELATPNAASLSIVGCLDSNQNAGPIAGVNSCDFSVVYDQYAGCTFQCTFTNIELGKIIVEKQTVTTDVNDATMFTFTGDAADTIGDDGTIEVDDLSPGTYSSIETVPDGWDLTDISCDDESSLTPSSGDTQTATATFELDPGETVKCTFTNTERGMADVTKRVAGSPLTGEQAYTFQIRRGASLDSNGTVIATATADAGDSTDVPFTCAGSSDYCDDFGGMAKLKPGDYQFCEIGMLPGWSTSLTGGFVPNGNAPDPDNSTYCINFTLDAGETESFVVDNTPPPDGDARTIGFWKNWTSCDGRGNQDPVLDETLALAGGSYLIGGYTIDSCETAVLLLDKREFTGRNKKVASDPCINAGSQLLASKLNATAGAGCAALTTLQTATDNLLIDAGFNGGACAGKGKGKQDLDEASGLNTNAGLLDDYNNNEPGSVCN